MVSGGSDGSDKRKRITPVRTTLYALVVVSLAGIVFVAGRHIGFDSGREQNRTDQYYQQAKQNAENTCIGIDGAAMAQCISEAKKTAQTKSETRQDLDAQQDMAEWAFWMMLASFLTFAITGLGVWFVKRTLDATLLAVKDTGKATEAMEESNKIARETGRKQVRAYIGVKSVTFEDGEDFNIPRFLIEIENKGVSPANIKNLDVKITWIGGKATSIYTFDRKIDFPCHAASPMNLPIDVETSIDECEGEGFFILSGVISYQDIFKDEHVEEFYFRTSGKTTLFDMELPERLSPFPLKSIVKNVQEERKKKKDSPKK